MPIIGTQGALTFIKLGGGFNYNSWLFAGTNVTRFEGSAFDSSENIYLSGVGGATGTGIIKSLWMKINVDNTGNIPPYIGWSTVSNITGNQIQGSLTKNKHTTLEFNSSNNITSIVTGKMNALSFSQINYPINAGNGTYGAPIVFSAPHNANLGALVGGLPTRTIGDFVFSNNTIVSTGITNQKPASNVSDYKVYFNSFYTSNGQLQYNKVYGNSSNVTDSLGSDSTNTTIHEIGNNYITTCNLPTSGIIVSIDNNIGNINWQYQYQHGSQNLEFKDSTSNGNNIFSTASGNFVDSYLINTDNTGNIIWALYKQVNVSPYTTPFTSICIDTNNSNLFTVGTGAATNNSNGALPIINFNANSSNINWQRGIYFIGTGLANTNVYFECSNINVTGNNMILSGTIGQTNNRTGCVIQLPKSGFIPGNGQYPINANLTMYYQPINESIANVSLTKTSLTYNLLTPLSSNSGNTTGTIWSNTASGTFSNIA